MRPNDETRIRNQLIALTEALNLLPSEAPLKRLHKSGTAAEFFTPDANLSLSGTGEGGSMQGKDQISENIRTARMSLQQLRIETRDVEVVVDPSGPKAQMKLTVLARVNGEATPQIHLLQMQWTKTNSTWLINQAVTASPLSR